MLPVICYAPKERLVWRCLCNFTKFIIKKPLPLFLQYNVLTHSGLLFTHLPPCCYTWNLPWWTKTLEHCTFLLQFLEEKLEILGSLKLLVPEAPPSGSPLWDAGARGSQYRWVGKTRLEGILSRRIRKTGTYHSKVAEFFFTQDGAFVWDVFLATT